MKDEILEKLKSVFNTLDNITDILDNIDITTDDMIDQIRITCNGELAPLEELIIKLEKS